ncbi:metallophosphoesterase [Marinospirillum insulare]|uniref:Calcineurin-like phosphoesterase domain-containing protein n=1 Tax=Marinospirillum insulare TaxID=217169 RepID=A0ABQ6A0J7_9GAMM|nr:metallophosphoesterase [Marinospirillum insulare]GLR64441.1 hypothetical protein GCM10007878_18790 [Marinospirillum insulare]
MRLRIFSDLHFETYIDGRDFPDADADVIILAGDIHLGTAGLDWAAKRFSGTPIIYVPGNHEYYGSSMPAMRKELRNKAERLGIHLLDNTSLELDGVKFLGTTLWTDFNLYAGDLEKDYVSTYKKALSFMLDYHIIEQPEGERFLPEESQRLHKVAVDWLTTELAKPFAGTQVVISHHAPNAACIPPRFQGDILSPAFASNLDQLMGKAKLWIHGHVHERVDFEYQGTRIIANPGGYPNEFEEPSFIPDLVIKVP